MCIQIIKCEHHIVSYTEAFATRQFPGYGLLQLFFHMKAGNNGALPESQLLSTNSSRVSAPGP